MTETEIVAELHPFTQEKYKKLREILSPEWQVYNGLRSFVEQEKLYAIGRTTGTIGVIVTRSVPGMSYHNYGLAMDWAYFKEGYKMQDPWELAPWKEYSDALEKVGGMTWGGHFIHADKPHCQLNVLCSVGSLLAAYKVGGLENAWKLVSINTGGN